MGSHLGEPLETAKVGHWVYETVKQETAAQVLAAADSALTLMDRAELVLELDVFLDVAWREYRLLVDQEENSAVFNELAQSYAALLDAEGVSKDAALIVFTQLCGAASAAVEPEVEFAIRYSQRVHGR